MRYTLRLPVPLTYRRRDVNAARFEGERKMAKIWVLQHHPAENLGAIAEALEEAALAWQYVRIFDGHPIPKDMKGAGGLIVMGGPETVYQLDRYPYLREEIGWYPVKLAEAARDDRLMRELPGEFMACHWHSDVFDLPKGAVGLASSEKTACQGFRYGDKAYGILFHAEMTLEIVSVLISEFGEGLKRVGIDGEAILTKAADYLPQLNEIGTTIFGRWAAPIQGTG